MSVTLKLNVLEWLQMDHFGFKLILKRAKPGGTTLKRLHSQEHIFYFSKDTFSLFWLFKKWRRTFAWKSRSSHGHCPISLLFFCFPATFFFRNTPLFITSFFVTSSDPIIIIIIIMTLNFMAHTHLKNYGEILVKSWKEPTRVPI